MKKRSGVNELLVLRELENGENWVPNLTKIAKTLGLCITTTHDHARWIKKSGRIARHEIKIVSDLDCYMPLPLNYMNMTIAQLSDMRLLSKLTPKDFEKLIVELGVTLTMLRTPLVHKIITDGYGLK